MRAHYMLGEDIIATRDDVKTLPKVGDHQYLYPRWTKYFVVKYTLQPIPGVTLAIIGLEEPANEKETTMDNAMTFSQALEAVKKGCKVARAGWNGKDMFIFLVPGSTFQVNRAPLLGIYEEGTEINYHAHVDMRTADGQIVPWLCSQTDLLAEDWEVVPS